MREEARKAGKLVRVPPVDPDEVRRGDDGDIDKMHNLGGSRRNGVAYDEGTTDHGSAQHRRTRTAVDSPWRA